MGELPTTGRAKACGRSRLEVPSRSCFVRRGASCEALRRRQMPWHRRGVATTQMVPRRRDTNADGISGRLQHGTAWVVAQRGPVG